VEDYKVVPKKDEIGWEIYIRMELLTSLNDYLLDKKMTEKDVIKFGRDICTALEMCEQHNVLHRDIKPDNIFVNEFGYFKLGDFGIARTMENMTSGMSQRGTPLYMAPEIFVTDKYDKTVDICSLGLVMYQMLNDGCLPFIEDKSKLVDPSASRIALEKRKNGEKIKAPKFASKEMANLILRACAFDPKTRFATASEMKKALNEVENGTYKIVPIDLNKTVSVKKQTDLDKTTSVKRPSNNSSVEENKNDDSKKSKLTILVVIGVILALIIGGCAIFGSNDNDTDSSEESKTSSASDLSHESNEVNNSVVTSEDASSEQSDDSENEEKEIAKILSEAEQLAQKKDYKGAIIKIENGLVSYADSDELKNKLEEYKTALTKQEKEKALNEAESYAQSENYLSAFNRINSALENYPDDNELKGKRDEYYNSYVTNELNSAVSLYNQGDILTAYKAIKKALSNFENEEKFITAAQKYENEYELWVLNEVDAYVQDGKYTQAQSLLATAAREFPNNSSIAGRKEEVDKYKTVALNTLTPINGGFNWNDGTPADPFGGTYNGIKNYAILYADEHRYSKRYSAEYKVDNLYDTLTFNVVPYSCFGQSGKSYIKIYADDVLRYTTSLITQKTQPYTVGVDISNSTYIRIVAEIGSYGCIMLTDIVLSSSPDFVTSFDSTITSLCTFDTFNGSITWNNSYPENTKNESYNFVKNYSVLYADEHRYSKTYSAEYYLNKEYNSISFDIAPYSCFGSSGKTYIKVYVDDVLVYTSPQITQKTAKFNTGAIDVSNADYIKIVGEIGAYGCTIISDVLLKNK
ncbi:MAG: protein kinase, partial [Clostridia bacterium]|nr:protein kinase [Clostridia bacterium]